MIHFAYPNVNLRGDGEFIGCGRFAVFEKERNPPEGYLSPKFETPNTIKIERTVSFFAPESFQSQKHIYEKKDEDKTYRGDSMDLAYFLSFISCSRPLSVKFLQNDTDIWCTGMIEVENVLDKTRGRFHLKLEGFLSDRHADRLFIVPAANMKELDNNHSDEILDKKIDCLSLKDLKQIMVKNGAIIEKKTILSVLPNEIPDLVDLLFDPLPDHDVRASKKPILARILISLMVIFLVCGGWLFMQKPSAEQILQHLENGMLLKTADLLNTSSAKDESIELLKASAYRAIPLNVQFQYQKPGEAPSKLYPPDAVDIQNLSLTHRDNYRLQITSGPEDRDIYLYVFQVDANNSVLRLFPNPEWSGAHYNPVHYGDFPCHIPPLDEKWIYLSPLDSNDMGKDFTETIYVIASPWEAKDIETLYGNLHQETVGENRERLFKQFIGQLKMRAGAGLPAVLYQKFSFRHDAGMQ